MSRDKYKTISFRCKLTFFRKGGGRYRVKLLPGQLLIEIKEFFSRKSKFGLPLASKIKYGRVPVSKLKVTPSSLPSRQLHVQS